jgi:hypothetical protein
MMQPVAHETERVKGEHFRSRLHLRAQIEKFAEEQLMLFLMIKVSRVQGLLHHRFFGSEVLLNERYSFIKDTVEGLLTRPART